ncbi:MAG: nucleotide exchange factor GrpE [Chloroflexi bacterium RBG_13_46_14]|nr:MAG: nucleotide exchange factor GrpE [Chloroflexi bacterium RBG_13_46_14]
MEEEIISENESQDDVLDGVEEEDVEVLKQSLLEEKNKAEEYLANWQRVQADFINFKRRSEKEKEELADYSRAAIIQCVLPILDDFDRAISAIPDQAVDSNWVEGVRMIERKLRAILESEGLSCIEAVGEPFDPYQHEAVRQESGEEGIVIEDIRKGYKYRDRVIRPSHVVVGSGESEEE